jgi:predicted nucleotidyltransferase
MADPNRALFESVVRLLAPVLDELVFLGGCTTGLFITDPAAGGIRPTKDVDAIVDVTSYAKYAALSERLRALGLAEDTTPGAPLCRWRRDEFIVDVMPMDKHVLGFSNRWYPAAIETAQTLQIAGHEVRVVTPALFIATKLDAFHGRGGGDIVASHDLEDIIAVVDGRPEMGSDVAAASGDVREYIGAEVRALLDNPDFTEALAGLLLLDAASQARRSLLMERLRRLATPRRPGRF